MSELPEEIFLNYVLFHRVNEEEIAPCRTFFRREIGERTEGMSFREAALEVNYWCAQEATYHCTDDRTLSALAVYRRGNGRCGEESVFTVNALRSVGVPARLVNAPKWSHCDDNHAWVEVWCDGKWYFTGACEPEPILNKGWFTNASSRAMMVHSRLFDLFPAEGEDVIGKEGAAVMLKQTARYAKVKTVSVKVTDKEGAAVKGAQVQFQVLNMGEYFPIAKAETDEKGTVSLVTGLGSVRVLAFLPEMEGFAQADLDTRAQDEISLTLTGEAVEAEDWRAVDVIAPVDTPVNPDMPTPEQKAEGTRRLNEANKIRKEKKENWANPELTAFLGQQCVGVDVNSMKPLDNLCHPVSVIREAEELAADAFGAAHAFLMVGGTTSSVQSMVLTACKRGDEIILPRNVHRSVLNALVLCGAVPVYVNPEVDQRLGISLGMKREQVAKAIAEHPNAVAVLVNNPTYYGICSDLRAIVRMAHDAGMLCLADEAHGTHFYFGGGLPVSAMAAGADMAAVSMHKSGGSLTQSSLLLTGPNVHAGYVRQIINLTQTTSGSYLLMSSLDISRRNLALRGRQVFHQVADMAEYAREEINAVGGYYAFGKELCNGNSVFDFDTTKLSVHTLDIGLAGIEVYDILRDEYDIQIEFGDIGNILAYLSIGDRPQEVERLVSALAEIKRRYHTDGAGLLSQEYIDPEVAASPQEAFYAPKKSLPLRETEGMVCSEFVMCYPPGIPILAPGERITAEILDYIEYAKAKGCSMTGPEDPDILRLNVLA